MAIDQSRVSRRFSFLLANGTEVFPVQMKRRDNGLVAFRVSAGGNTLADSEDVDEETMCERVLKQAYAVRCSSLDGKTTGLYKPGHRAVREVRRNSA